MYVYEYEYARVFYERSSEAAEDQKGKQASEAGEVQTSKKGSKRARQRKIGRARRQASERGSGRSDEQQGRELSKTNEGQREATGAWESMGRMTIDTRYRVVILHARGFQVGAIQKRLQEEGIRVSKTSLCKLIKKYRLKGTVKDLRWWKPPTIFKEEHYRFIDEQMAENTELTSRQLQRKIEEFPNVQASLSTVMRARRYLGWVCKKTRYCALIREENKQKRLDWCRERQADGETFRDVIWTDECSVQLESNRKLSYHKKGEPAPLKGRPKHPAKIHVWAGISRRGATPIILFTGIMTATKYVDILNAGLVPFINTVLPDGHRFQQDNDPKHTSRYAQNYYHRKGIEWWKTPASSPDLNPIENVWGSMKQYLRTEVKPKTVGELKSGIKTFWKTLTPDVCRKYIGHLHKVIPKVIEVNGEASGY